MQQQCSVDTCESPAKALGMCQSHYQRNYLYGDPLAGGRARAPRGQRSICRLDGCDGIQKGNGLCEGHYMRWRKYGDAMDTSPLRPMHPRGGVCSVDDCGRPSRHKGMCPMHHARVQAHGDPRVVKKVSSLPVGSRRTDESGYVSVKQPGHPNARAGGWVREHVMVVADSLGRPIRRGESVHHRNGIRDDNRLENLQLMALGMHPAGQSVEDLVAFAREVLDLYG